jgi:hypothetical protein
MQRRIDRLQDLVDRMLYIIEDHQEVINDITGHGPAISKTRPKQTTKQTKTVAHLRVVKKGEPL